MWFSNYADWWVVTITCNRHMLCVVFRVDAHQITQVHVDGQPRVSVSVDMFESWLQVLIHQQTSVM